MSNRMLDINEKPVVFVVDDQPYYHALVEKALGEICTLNPLGDGESALMEVAEKLPALILLDVEMPGLGGYETCRRFRSMDETSDVPIVFLSAHNEIEDQLKGYEAGGQDYLTKPFDSQKLRTKVQLLLEQAQQRTELKARMQSASSVAMTAMTSMGEMGIVLESLKRFNTCKSITDLAKALITGVSEFGLQVVVQIRTPAEKLTLSESGVASPIEESIIDHMAKMDRIVEYKTRLAITYHHVSLLINGLSSEDSDRNGRLRDYLAILAEAADARVQGIMGMLESRLRQMIEESVTSVRDALAGLDAWQREHRNEANTVVLDMMENFERGLQRVSLSDAQEDFLRSTVRDGVERIIGLQSDELQMQATMSSIINKLYSALHK